MTYYLYCRIVFRDPSYILIFVNNITYLKVVYAYVYKL